MTPQSLCRPFAVRRSERWVLAVALLLLGAVQLLYLSKYLPLFAGYSDHSWQVFMRNFHTSGFDPFSYEVLTHWHQGWDTLRHPFLALLLWPLAQLNEAILTATGFNGCLLWMALILWVCGGYGWLMLYRTLHDIVGLRSGQALLLCLFFYGLAYVLLATYVPDHFGLSLFLLLTVLYISASKLTAHRLFTPLESALLFAVTAGVTLTNGVAIFIMVACVNGKAVFKPRMVGGFAASTVVLLTVSQMTFWSGDGAQVSVSAPVEQQMRWVKEDVSKGEVLVENFFGESLQLHRKHVLGDVLAGRPVIVAYNWKAQYGVEAIILMLLLAGAWLGRRERLVWMVMGILAFNVALHIVLGFAIDEVYIMTAHWAMCLPVATAFLLKKTSGYTLYICIAATILITLYLWIYHGYLLHRYLTWPMSYK